MIKNLRILFSFLLVILTFGVNAQKYFAKSSVNTTSPEVNERIEVNYKLFTKENSVSLRNLRFGIESNSFKGFTINQHGQASMEFDIRNRNKLSIFKFIYRLKATNLGKQKILGLTISFNGKEYKTKPVVIKVVKGVKDNSISSKLKLRFTPSKFSCYIAETTRHELVSNVQKIGSYILTPTESGLLKTPHVIVSFAFGSTLEISPITLKYKAQTFKVEALNYGAPNNFDGLVGEYRLNQKTDKKVIATIDALPKTT